MNNPQLPIRWGQGQHITVVGDTGTGKTFLVKELVKLREVGTASGSVVILRTKPDDIVFPGFRTFRTAKALDDWHNDRILLDPKYEKQGIEGFAMLNKVWEQGGWTVVIDEQWYAEQELKLKQAITRLLTQGRSKAISVVNGVQRPVEISRFTISQSTHLFTFRVDGRDLDTIKYATTPLIVDPVESLRGHDFVYYNRATRIIAKGNARYLDRVLIPSTSGY